MTFCFYLCQPCAETYGQIAGMMLMPDEVFFEHVKQEQLARHGRYLTPDEWARLPATDPLVRLVTARTPGGNHG
jgi:hypothetical protein